jgi:hypothetical protein
MPIKLAPSNSMDAGSGTGIAAKIGNAWAWVANKKMIRAAGTHRFKNIFISFLIRILLVAFQVES